MGLTWIELLRKKAAKEPRVDANPDWCQAAYGCKHHQCQAIAIVFLLTENGQQRTRRVWRRYCSIAATPASSIGAAAVEEPALPGDTTVTGREQSELRWRIEYEIRVGSYCCQGETELNGGNAYRFLMGKGMPDILL